MHISERGLRLIEGFEGWSSRAYWDPYGRVWTRGYGETEGIHQFSPAISRAQGQANLKRLVEQRYEPAIRTLGVEFNQAQWDALCSFVWNLGPGILQGQLGALLRGHNDKAFAQAMLAYDHAGGQVLPGLARRRREESALFSSEPPPYVPADEARWIRQFPKSRGIRRKVLVRVMTARRKEIWRLAEHERDGWKTLNRRERYRALLARTGG